MGRKCIGEQPLSKAEKQRRYRNNQKAKIAALQAANAPDFTFDEAKAKENIKLELKKSWEPELKAERLAAERKKGRELAMKADNSRADGRVLGLCEAAGFFIGKYRVDIAHSLLSHFMINRETAIKALQTDKRTKSLTLEYLDKAGVWKNETKGLF